jgi:hypothetical protein
MKKWFAFVAVMASMFFVTATNAAEPQGNIDDSALSALGLSGMEQVSDAEGTQVRGRFGAVNGIARATWFGGYGGTVTKAYAKTGSGITFGFRGAIAFGFGGFGEGNVKTFVFAAGASGTSSGRSF